MYIHIQRECKRQNHLVSSVTLENPNIVILAIYLMNFKFKAITVSIFLENIHCLLLHWDLLYTDISLGVGLK